MSGTSYLFNVMLSFWCLVVRVISGHTSIFSKIWFAIRSRSLIMLEEVSIGKEKVPVEKRKISKMLNVTEFYRNEQILITGGTGFVGKLLISKLLSSCSEIEKIVLIVRKKENTTLDSRMHSLFDDAVFEPLRNVLPNFRDKIRFVEGDCEKKRLGLSHMDMFQITEHITIVFHCASNIEFDNDLKTEININVFGALEVVKLAKRIRKLKSMVYVSSAYAHCHLPIVEEKPYTYCYHYRALLKLMESDTCHVPDRDILGEIKNTYFYSKAVAERAVIEECVGFPVAIFRPSAIISTWKEPVPGWTDKAFAPTAIVKYLTLGYFSSILCGDNTIVDMIPGDFAINALIAIAWDTHNRFVNGTLTEPRIYNLTSTMDNPLKFKSFLTRVFIMIREMPSCQAIWYPSLHFHESTFLNDLCSSIRPKLLVRCVQLCYFFSDKNSDRYSRLNRINKTYDVLTNSLRKVARKPCIYLNDNSRELWSDMCSLDKEIFFFDLKKFSWDEYLRTYYDGVLRFILKERRNNEDAKNHYFKLQFASRMFDLVVGIAICLFIFSIYNFF